MASEGRPRPPTNMQWRGNTLHGRVWIKGKLHRWTLRTSDVEVAAARLAEDVERMKTDAFYAHRPPLAVERQKWRNCPTLAELHDPPPSVEGHIYVVGFRDYVKIGWSLAVLRRLTVIQDGLPENIVVYGVIEGGRQKELALQRRFRQLRLSREWFRLTGALEAWVDEGCQPADFVENADSTASIVLESHFPSQPKRSVAAGSDLGR